MISICERKEVMQKHLKDCEAVRVIYRSKLELARELNVSYITLQTYLKKLEDKGVLRSKEGTLLVWDYVDQTDINYRKVSSVLIESESPINISIYVILLKNSYGDISHMTVQEIADAARLTVKSIKPCLAGLKKAGFIEAEKEGRKNFYKLLADTTNYINIDVGFLDELKGKELAMYLKLIRASRGRIKKEEDIADTTTKVDEKEVKQTEELPTSPTSTPAPSALDKSKHQEDLRSMLDDLNKRQAVDKQLTVDEQQLNKELALLKNTKDQIDYLFIKECVESLNGKTDEQKCKEIAAAYSNQDGDITTKKAKAKYEIKVHLRTNNNDISRFMPYVGGF